MVFVTVGNAKQGFSRLLDAVEKMAADGLFGGESVLIQSGHNPQFRPRFCEQRPFIPMDEFDELLSRAAIVICHGGCTQLTAVRMGKAPVVMPRLKKYGEHVNDHQLQLVRALADEGRIIPAYEPEELAGAIAEARRRNARPAAPPRSPMLALLEQAISEVAAR